MWPRGPALRYEKSATALGGMLYPSPMFRINGVDAEKAGDAPWETIERLMAEAEQAGRPPLPAQAARSCGRSATRWNGGRTSPRSSNPDGSAVDGTDVEQLSTASSRAGSRCLRRLRLHPRTAHPASSASYIVDIAPQIGIRETRRDRRATTS